MTHIKQDAKESKAKRQWSWKTDIQLYNRILAIRKEKSRDAARSRRGKENYEFYELAKVLLSSCYHQKGTFVIVISPKRYFCHRVITKKVLLSSCYHQQGTFVIVLSPKRYFCHQIYHLQGTVIAFVIKVIIFKVYLLLSYSMFYCRHPQGTFVIIVIMVKVLSLSPLRYFCHSIYCHQCLH